MYLVLVENAGWLMNEAVRRHQLQCANSHRLAAPSFSTPGHVSSQHVLRYAYVSSRRCFHNQIWKQRSRGLKINISANFFYKFTFRGRFFSGLKVNVSTENYIQNIDFFQRGSA